MDAGNLVFIAILFGFAIFLAYVNGLENGKKKAPRIAIPVKVDPNRDKTLPITDEEGKAFVMAMQQQLADFWHSGKASTASVNAVASISTAFVAKAFAVAAQYAVDEFSDREKFSDFMSTFEGNFDHFTNKYLSETMLPVRVTFHGPGKGNADIQQILNQMLGDAKNGNQGPTQ